MALLLRAITLPPERRESNPEGTRRVDVGGLTAWASELDETTAFGRDDLVHHHRLVSDIFARVDACLPARFPSWLDEAQLRTRQADLRARLERIKGCCELAITGTWPTSHDETRDATKIDSGRAYLAQRQRVFATSDSRLARASALADELERSVGAVIVDARRQLCPSSNVAFSLALLIQRASVEEALSRMARGAEDVRILVNGPWPPYTFAGVGREEQGDG